MSSNLLAFLRARLREDQEIAEQAHGHHVFDGTGIVTAPIGSIVLPSNVANHVSRWNPSRALREIEAKRRILYLHEHSHECSVYDDQGEIDNCHWCIDSEECSTLCLLASVYSDHPDYNQDWAP